MTLDYIEPPELTDEGEPYEYGVASYLAMYGCDPCYDRPPRKRGDGYLFYNYSEDGDKPDFLRKFIPALGRTIEEFKADEENRENLTNIRKYVEQKFKALCPRLKDVYEDGECPECGTPIPDTANVEGDTCQHCTCPLPRYEE